MCEPSSVPRCSVASLQRKGKQWFVDYLPITQGNKYRFYVDGQDYCADLHRALMDANSTVFLTGLHFMEDFRLIRGGNDNQYKLVEVLKTLGRKGKVQVFLLVSQFWEKESMIGWESFIKGQIKSHGLGLYLPETYNLFEHLKAYKNLHCRTDVHPHSETVFGTNHQKTVVIDDKLCFLGGIDLTFIDGDRWDTKDHKTDSRSVERTEKYWHDVHMRLEGPAVQFVRDNFHARWNHGRLHTLEWGTLEGTLCDEFCRDVPLGEGIISVRDQKHYEFPRITLKDLKRPRPDKSETPDERWVQIVRSMPKGPYEKQKPHWNLSKQNWERSCKDAYLIGIKAAEQYIYLENQWVADEDIWEELKRAAERNRANKDFRIIVVLPHRFLKEAGLGANQEMNIDDEVQAVRNAAASEKTFAVYCLVQDFVDEKRVRSEQQIYVHSKILIVDDAWALIGSANAGGISLEGHRPGADQPDTELSAIVLDNDFAKNLRKRIWEEHLGGSVSDCYSPADADRFRELAKHPKQGRRLRFSEVYLKPEDPGRDYDGIFSLVASSARMVCDRADLRWNFPVALIQPPVRFAVISRQPPFRYSLWYRWACELGDRNEQNQVLPSYQMLGLPSKGRVHHYSDDAVAYVGDLSAKAINGRITRDLLTGHILCRVQLVPAGKKPDNANIEYRSFVLRYEVKFMEARLAKYNMEPGWDKKPRVWGN